MSPLSSAGVHAPVQWHPWAHRALGPFLMHSQDLSDGNSNGWTVGGQLWRTDVCPPCLLRGSML